MAGDRNFLSNLENIILRTCVLLLGFNYISQNFVNEENFISKKIP